MAIIDDTTLVVTESHADRISVWIIADHETLADSRVGAALDEGEAPDGICVDAEGAISYASVPGRHCVRVAEAAESSPRLAPTAAALRARSAVRTSRPFVVANKYSATGASDGGKRARRVRRAIRLCTSLLRCRWW